MSRLNQIHVGNYNLNTPVLFASYRVCDYPRAGLRFHPWDITQTEAVLLNAFDILANPRTFKCASNLREGTVKVHDYIEFDGPIIMDSGAFNFLQHPEITISAEAVIQLGVDTEADVSVVLDHPFPPKSTTKEIKGRWANTRHHTQVMFDFVQNQNGTLREHFQLMPVVHGHDPRHLKRAIHDVREIFGEALPLVGIGSLAPLAKNGNKRLAADVIQTARQAIPDSHIHCFSLGSALLMLFAFYCGADSVDSQTWVMSAAFKQVQLPGRYLTRLSQQDAEKDPEKYNKMRYMLGEHLLCLVEEERYSIKDWDTGEAWTMASMRDVLTYFDYLEDRGGVNHVHRRACHNLHTFNFEVRRVREEIARNNLETFIAERLADTKYLKDFEYAVEQKAKTPK